MWACLCTPFLPIGLPFIFFPFLSLLSYLPCQNHLTLEGLWVLKAGGWQKWAGLFSLLLYAFPLLASGCPIPTSLRWLGSWAGGQQEVQLMTQTEGLFPDKSINTTKAQQPGPVS